MFLLVLSCFDQGRSLLTLLTAVVPKRSGGGRLRGEKKRKKIVPDAAGDRLEVGAFFKRTQPRNFFTHPR